MPINKKDYHPKWKTISRWIRSKRAGNRCEWCGATNHKAHPITGALVILTVAHLDRDRNNNRFSNLAALCQGCHLFHDLCQHLYSRKYGSATRYKTGQLFPLPPVTVCHKLLEQRKSIRCSLKPTTRVVTAAAQIGLLFDFPGPNP
jgi:hypothetical protein